MQERVYHTPSQIEAHPRQRLMPSGERDSMPQFVHKEVISNSCSDVASRVFHDWIKPVESVTFLTSSYCFKLLKYDFRISQGSVVTVLRRDGHRNIRSTFPQDVACQILLQSTDVIDSYSKKYGGWLFASQCRHNITPGDRRIIDRRTKILLNAIQCMQISSSGTADLVLLLLVVRWAEALFNPNANTNSNSARLTDETRQSSRRRRNPTRDSACRTRVLVARTGALHSHRRTQLVVYRGQYKLHQWPNGAV